MYDTQIRNRFIELRAQGWSLARIAKELHIHVGSISNWNRRFQTEVRQLSAVELEALQDRILASHEVELTRLTSHLNAIEAELEKRSCDKLPTSTLLRMAGMIRSQIAKARLQPDFDLSPLPDHEYPYPADVYLPDGPTPLDVPTSVAPDREAIALRSSPSEGGPNSPSPLASRPS